MEKDELQSRIEDAIEDAAQDIEISTMWKNYATLVVKDGYKFYDETYKTFLEHRLVQIADAEENTKGFFTVAEEVEEETTGTCECCGQETEKTRKTLVPETAL